MSENPFGAFAEAWREDPAWRARAEADPKAALAEKGVDLSGVDEVRIAVDTPRTVHLVLPPESDAALPDAALRSVSGGVYVPGSVVPNGRQSHGIWGPDGRFLGYTHGGNFF